MSSNEWNTQHASNRSWPRRSSWTSRPPCSSSKRGATRLPSTFGTAPVTDTPKRGADSLPPPRIWPVPADGPWPDPKAMAIASSVPASSSWLSADSRPQGYGRATRPARCRHRARRRAGLCPAPAERRTLPQSGVLVPRRPYPRLYAGQGSGLVAQQACLPGRAARRSRLQDRRRRTRAGPRRLWPRTAAAGRSWPTPIPISTSAPITGLRSALARMATP